MVLQQNISLNHNLKLENYSNKSLRILISVLINKKLQPHKPHQLGKPNIFLHHKTEPTVKIQYYHNHIKEQLNKKQIYHMVKLLLEQLHQNLTPIIKKTKFRFPLPITHTNKLVASRVLKNLFNTAKILLPNKIGEKIDTIITTKNIPSSSRYLFNYNETANQPAPNKPTKNFTCLCHLNKYKKYLNHYKHIDTNDVTIISTTNPTLKYLEDFAQYGANYIPTPEFNPNMILKYFNKDLNNYISKLCKISNLSILEFENWKNYLFKNYELFVNSNKPNSKISHNLTKIKNQANILHKNYTITPTDKMKNNYRITCTEYFQRILYQKVTSNEVLLSKEKDAPTEKSKKPAYICLKTEPKVILKQQTQFLIKNNIPLDKQRLPYIYPIFKSHKNGSRGVTASAHIATTQLNIILHLAFKLMLKTQLHHYNQKELTTNINYTWRIDNSTDLIHKLQQLNKNENHIPQTLQSFDIERFYDNVDIPELEKIINIFTPKIFNITHKQFINVDINKKHAYWANTKHPNHLSLTAKEITNVQNWQLNNAIILYNGKAWKQTKGIAQGTNQSPDLADIILGHYEKEFMKFHKNNKNIIDIFNNTSRKMDDILCINNNIIQEWLYQDNKQPNGIYPKKYFNITSDQEKPINTVNYLDTTIFFKTTPKKFKDNNHWEEKSQAELRNIAKKLKLNTW
jgi:hypothetical protein